MRKLLILLILAVITTANLGCCARFRNWLHRGAPCGTRTQAPAMMGAPIPLGAPFASQQAAPAPQQQQVVVPQPAVQCCPQPCPQPCVPCDPCPDPCSPCGSGWYSGYYNSDNIGSTPSSSYEGKTYIVPDSDSSSYETQDDRNYADPAPAEGSGQQ